jgi:hypothetical protein
MPIKRATAVAPRNITRMEMNNITIFRHRLNKRANKTKKNIMKRKKLRLKMMRKSHLSNYTTSTKKTMISLSNTMDIQKIKQMTCMLFTNKLALYIRYLQHKSYNSATSNQTLLSTQ